MDEEIRGMREIIGHPCSSAYYCKYGDCNQPVHNNFDNWATVPEIIDPVGLAKKISFD